tara:strand:+ start:31132 stop:31887 length:756 start_codon:yes stop_codon:yes gene_type:complete
MKSIRNKSTLLTSIIKTRLSELHKLKNNSQVLEYTSVSFTENNNFNTDNVNTNTTDGDFQIVFENFYNFIHNILPEPENVTLYKLKQIETLININLGLGIDLSVPYKIRGYFLFIQDVLQGNYEMFEREQFIEAILSIPDKFDYNFIILAKDSEGTTHAQTESITASQVQQNTVSVLSCPMSDSQTENKDGFAANDVVFLFFKNTTTNKEIIIFTNPSVIIANNLATIPLEEYLIKQYTIKHYNPVLFSLL